MEIKGFLCSRFRTVYLWNIFLSFGCIVLFNVGEKALKPFLSGSEYQLPVWPIFDHRDTLNFFESLVRLPGSIEQPHGCERYPQRGIENIILL